MKHLRWVMLISLALIWGSSFILMKFALKGLSPVQVGALRMILSAIFLLVIGFHKIKLIEKKDWKYIFLNALLGTFFPVFLFTYAVQHIDSSIVAVLNSLTPLITLILGLVMFGFLFTKKQIAGVLIGFIGSLILIIISAGLNPDDNYWYALLIILASIGYAFNVNILKKYLSDLDAMAIAVGNFLLVLIPALFVLWYSNFFKLDLIHDKSVYTAIGYISILAIVGTALAKVFFNRLVQISSPIFASSVTYLIPIIALFWGILDGEKIHLSQIMSGLTILIGVYLVNQKTTT